MGRTVPIIPISSAMDNIVHDETGDWFFDYKNNFLCKIDLENYIIDQIAYINRPEQYKKYEKAYGEIIIVNKKIIITPEAPIPIPIFDIVSKNTVYITYDIDESVFPGKIFSSVIQFNDQIYFLPCCYNAIISMNIISQEIHYYSLDNFFNRNGICIWSGYYFVNNILYFALYNTVVSFNLENNNINVIFNMSQDEGIAGVVGDKNGLWIVPIKANKLYKLDFTEIDNGREVGGFPSEYSAGEFSFSKIIDKGDYAFFLPRDANICICLEKKSEKLFKIDSKSYKSTNYYSKYMFFSTLLINNDVIMLFESDSGDIRFYNKFFDFIGIKHLYYNPYKLHRSIEVSSDEVILENDLMDLKYMIGRVIEY